MKITALDAYTIDFNGLPWAGIEDLGEFVRYDRTDRSELIERASNSDAIFTNKFEIDEVALSRLPKLKYIGVTATGTNQVALGAAAARGTLLIRALDGPFAEQIVHVVGDLGRVGVLEAVDHDLGGFGIDLVQTVDQTVDDLVVLGVGSQRHDRVGDVVDNEPDVAKEGVDRVLAGACRPPQEGIEALTAAQKNA